MRRINDVIFSFNVYDSLAEAYMNSEQWGKARQYYEKSLELNPRNDNARKMLAKMEERWVSFNCKI